MTKSVIGKDTLDTIAGKINAAWKRWDDLRVSTAKLLLEAKTRIEAGEDPSYPTFFEWCHDKLTPTRTERDIRRLLKIANAPEPDKEANRQRQKARESMARTRARRRDQRWSATEGSDQPDQGDDDDTDTDDAIFDRALAYFRRCHTKPKGVRISMVRRVLIALGVTIEMLQEELEEETVH